MGRRRAFAPWRAWFHPARVALGLVLVLVAAGLYVGTETSTGWADTGGGVTLTPVADATVSDDARDTNFGGAPTLGSDNKPRKESYLRFAVPAGATGQATLRMWVLDPTKDGPLIRRYDGVLDEMAITWNSRVTALSGTAVDSGPLTAGSWAEWDVSGLLSGPGDVTLGLVADTEDGVDFGSRESDHSPQLVIGPAPGQSTFGAVADTRAEEKYATTTFGTSPGLAVDAEGRGDGIVSYLRFAVTGFAGAVGRATLRVYVTDASADGPTVFRTADGWSETGLTWATKPAATGPAVVDVGRVSSGWTDIDVTGAVTGNGNVNLMLVGDDDDGMWFRAREAPEPERPHLVVETATAPTTSTSTTTSPSTTSTSSSTTTTTVRSTDPECGPNWGTAEPIGKLGSGLGEMSGFAASPVHRSWGWGIRDSGNPASLYGIRPGGSSPTAVEFRAYGLSNSDWEDVAYTPGFAPGSGHLWVLENVGNSWTGHRWIYQFEELDPGDAPPLPPTTATTTTAPPPPPPATHVGSYRWAYPDEQANTETMFVFDGDLVVVTKTSPSRVYRFNAPLMPYTVNVPTYVGTLPIGNVLSIGAMSIDQRTLAFSNHGKIDVYENTGDVHDLAALISNPIFHQNMASDNREGGSFFPYGSCDIILVAESKTLWRLKHR